MTMVDEVRACVRAWAEWTRGWTPAAGARRGVCLSCVDSPVLPELSTLKGLPHEVLHPLLESLRLVEVDANEANDDWLDAVLSDWYTAARPKFDRSLEEESRRISAALAELWSDLQSAALHARWRKAQIRGELIEAVAAEIATTGVVDSLRIAVDGYVAELVTTLSEPVEHTDNVVDHELCRMRVDATLEAWFLWLPLGTWKTADGIPDQTRCLSCTGDRAPLVDLSAPHSVLHQLRVSLAHSRTLLIRDFRSRVSELPSESSVQRFTSALDAAITRRLSERSDHVERALRLYVEAHIEREVDSATRWLFVQDSDESE